MDKHRVMPVLAGAVLAVSLTACQGMMGGHEAQQTSSAPSASTGATAAAGQPAASSDLVRDVQRGLATRGYDVGPQDGVYGASTEQALRRFQQDRRLTASGQIDGQTLAALGVIGGASSTASRDYVPTSRRQGASAAGSRSSVGLASHQVREVQQNLADRGYDPGKVDGLWGPRTRQALSGFQRDQNLQANGRPDQQTLAALGVETGSPGTQTGQLPEPRRNPPPSETPGEQQGQLPPTGSQAPGSAPEPNRSTVGPEGTPELESNPPPR
ncbi:MAG: peptidoglycan-binding protein [Magnetospirillum sp.]|nr:peptidoglycan-binding protein [Magnetospirillum sp.]